MVERRITLQTVADRVGVTKMTVSNAFARPDRVSPALRERVLAAAAELGYTGPDPKARALAGGRTGTVGVLLTDQPATALDDEVSLKLIAGVARGLAARSLSLVLLADRPGSDFLPARDVAMDGAVVYACSERSEGLDHLLARRLPTVGVDQFEAPELDLVNIDDRGGARTAAEHVGALGHRRVAGLISWVDARHGVAVADPGRLATPKQRARWAGWCDGLAEHDVRPTVWGRPYELHRDEAAEIAREMLGSDDRPTAVLCFSDVIAAGVLDAAAELGLSVPDDLSVAGFDDSSLAAGAGLTTVRQDLDGKGARAVEFLLARLDGAQHEPRHVVLPCELVVRATTGPAPG
jgi:DNA-binding LacI/PurR family transcriptional regulator